MYIPSSSEEYDLFDSLSVKYCMKERGEKEIGCKSGANSYRIKINGAQMVHKCAHAHKGGGGGGGKAILQKWAVIFTALYKREDCSIARGKLK